MLRVSASFCAEVPNHTSLLALSDMFDLPLSFGCRGGSCGSCIVEVISGLENLSPRTDREEILVPDFANGRPEDRCRLACQVVVFGPCHLVPVD